MTIWVDADACPNVIKEILYRAAERMQMPLVLVANQSLRVRAAIAIYSYAARRGRFRRCR